MGEAAPKEPTMEDILASIRKIIAQDDQAEPSEQRGAAEGKTVAGSGQQGSAANDVSAMPERTGPRPAQPSAEMTAPQRENPPQAKPSDSLAGLAAQMRSAEIAKPSPAATDRPPVTAPRPDTSSTGTDDRADASSASGWKSRRDPGDGPANAVPGQEFRSRLVDVGAPSRAAAAPPSSPPDRAGRLMPDRMEAKPQPVERQASPAAAAPDPQTEAFREALVSPSTERAVSGSIDRLRQSVEDDTQAKVEAVMRPILREWLDDNLPGLIERVVREEIARIAGER